ncbi:MAG: D-glycero-beta-D-manno-heptose 1-phosphate adenylyltransferase [Deltaproteobacteria bacterium]|uniref:D-glycero-beta-D-manno-heptose 1-phosphate adenylyltransferase n=1 Tax=Candidatus Zymogenus saltonus TaxID=2844893 RepID=A0A9D8KDR8_9DELT|nr:D-glycero-beta-D-manno-heptose 1-phosphate adenylyltransferase [Candidatus Zymogenus saltonus]
MSRDKIYKSDELAGVIRGLKAEGKTVVFTNGCFDILHVGHVRYLAVAKGEGDVLVVGVNSDSSVRGLKGQGRPVQDEESRAEIIASLRSVDYVVIFDESDPLSLILKLKPDVLVKGEDWQAGEIIGGKEVESWGGRVVRAKLSPGSSTTSIIEKIRGG